MSAYDSIEYTLSSVILLSDLVSTTVRRLRMLSALVVHTTKHGYVNSVGLPQSIRSWQ